MEVPFGYCQCGCGGKTKIAKQSDTARGVVRGIPIKYICGHNLKNKEVKSGKEHPHWKGGRMIHEGYTHLLKKDHPNGDKDGYVREHILIAEKALGKILPNGAQIHHINENRSDNRPDNLVICQDHGYHRMIHRRMRAYKACGHGSWRKCWICKEYDALENLSIHGRSICHNKCRNDRRETRAGLRLASN